MVKLSGLSKKVKKAPTGAPGDTEARILAAARKEFIAKGESGARMQVIAAEAGVNKALLHYYYRSKQRLYQIVLQDTLRSVWGSIQAELRSQGTPAGLEPMVHTFVSTFIRTLAANPDFPLFMFREMAGGGHAAQPAFREVLQKFGDVPAGILAALKAEVKAGRIKPVNPVHFLMNVMGMCVTTFLALPMIRQLAPALGIPMDFGEAFLEDRIRAITDMVFHGIHTQEANRT